MPTKEYSESIDISRLLLMLLVCIQTFGLPGQYAADIRMILEFATPAFFMISGYLVLGEEEGRNARIWRTVKHTAGTLLVLTVCYFIINVIYYQIYYFDIFSTLSYKEFWFNYLVLGVWQYNIGDMLWYVQALLFAYVILFLLDKIKVLKLDWLLCIPLLVFSFISSEFAAVVGGNFFGFSYLPAGFFTRALPYLLLGSLLYKSRGFWEKVPMIVYLVLAVLGAFMTLKEIQLLHKVDLFATDEQTIGGLLMAFSFCSIIFSHPHWGSGLPFLAKHSNVYFKTIYFVCPALGSIIAWSVATVDEAFYNRVKGWMGPLVILLSMLIALLFGWINDLLIQRFGAKMDLDSEIHQRVDWKKVLTSLKPSRKNNLKAKKNLDKLKELSQSGRPRQSLLEQTRSGLERIAGDSHTRESRRPGLLAQLRSDFNNISGGSRRSRRRPVFREAFSKLLGYMKPRRKRKH